METWNTKSPEPESLKECASSSASLRLDKLLVGGRCADHATSLVLDISPKSPKEPIIRYSVLG